MQQKKKNNTKIKIAAALGTTAILLGSGALAANSTKYSEEGLERGMDTAKVNPITDEKVTTDQFDNVLKDVGEEAGLVDEKTDKPLFTINVSKVTVTDTCPSRIPDMNFSPENGSFLILDIEASADEALAAKTNGTKSETYMPLIAEAFSVTGNDGSIERNVTSQAAWSCFDDSQLVPAVVNPGESVKGKLVLDVSNNTGTVAYDPENNGGWSWKY